MRNRLADALKKSAADFADVKDVMLSGNVYEALQDIAAIDDRPQWVSGEWAWIQPMRRMF